MPSGSNASIAYCYEGYYDGNSSTTKGGFKNTNATDCAIPFAIGAKLGSFERNNNIEVIFGLGKREATHLAEKQFTGTFSMDGVLSNPWFLLSVFGGYSVADLGIYQHTFSPAVGIASMTVKNCIDLGNTDVQWLYKGCVCTNCSISASVGEVVNVKLDYAYADETLSTDNYTAQVYDARADFDVYTFAHGNLYWDGKLIANVQSVEFTINPNQEMVFGLGSRMATMGANRNIEYTMSATVFFLNPADMLRYFYNGTSGGTTPTNVSYLSNGLKLVFNNGKEGSDLREISFAFNDAKINTDSLPQSPSELIMENVDIKATTCVITAKNNTSQCPTLSVLS